eukprot:5538619-Amphidinium_carterae.1
MQAEALTVEAPPTSKKLAGLPPNVSKRSMVAIARPAPFTSLSYSATGDGFRNDFTPSQESYSPNNA